MASKDEWIHYIICRGNGSTELLEVDQKRLFSLICENVPLLQNVQNLWMGVSVHNQTTVN